MYAIVKIGSQQHRVAKNDEIKVEKLAGKVGKKVEIKDVLLLVDKKKVVIGQPTVKKAKVVGEIVGEGREKKVIAFHKRRRKNSKKKQGHRQAFTRLKIKEIKTS